MLSYHMLLSFIKFDYRNWCEENGFRATDRARFDTDILETFGIENVKQRFDEKQYRGYKLDRATLVRKFRTLYNDEAYEFNICDKED